MLSELQKISAIEDCKKYADIFNKCSIAWLDATPHNMMFDRKTLKCLPIDYANEKIYDEEELKKINLESFEKIKEYINTLKYRY